MYSANDKTKLEALAVARWQLLVKNWTVWKAHHCKYTAKKPDRYD